MIPIGSGDEMAVFDALLISEKKITSVIEVSIVSDSGVSYMASKFQVEVLIALMSK